MTEDQVNGAKAAVAECLRTVDKGGPEWDEAVDELTFHLDVLAGALTAYKTKDQ